MSDEFDLWYYGDGDGGYPRKEARGDARKAFVQARRIASLDELVEGRKKYAAEKRGTERQFIKLPATWLRAECWCDDFTEEPNPVRDMGIDERREYGRRLVGNVFKMSQPQEK